MTIQEAYEKYEQGMIVTFKRYGDVIDIKVEKEV